ncbi:MAG: DNA internalization-related competence protein ComEC/Rec2 [Armatimonadota bacterium]
MPHYKMALLAVCYALGIVIAELFAIPALLVITAVLIIASIIIFPKKLYTAIILSALLMITAGVRYISSTTPSNNDILFFIPEKPEAVRGIVSTDFEPSGNKLMFTLKTEKVKIDNKWHKADGYVMASCYVNPREIENFTYGREVTILTTPYIPSDPSNLEPFSWKQYLRKKGIYTCISIKSADDVIVHKSIKANPLIKFSLMIKEKIYGAIISNHNQESGSLIAGMVLGSYSYLPQKTLDDFTHTGTLHLLAASGFNCAVLIFTLLPILKWLRLKPILQTAILILALYVYLFIVGPKASIVRATIMASMILLAMPLSRVAHMKNIFFASALVILIIRPSDIFDVGFQLSFLAVWALISIIPVFEILFEKRKNQALIAQPKSFDERLVNFYEFRKSEIVNVALGSFVISLMTSPLVAYHFNYFSFVSIPANVAVLFSVPVVFAVGCLDAFFVNFPIINSILGFVGDIACNIMMAILDFLGNRSWTYVSVPSPNIFVLGGYFILLSVAINYAAKKHKLSYVFAVFLILSTLFWWQSSTKASELSVAFLDVGTGQCVVVHTPNGKVMVVDCGSSDWKEPKKLARKVVAPYISRLGKDEIDIAVITHPDADHINAFEELFKIKKPKVVLDSGYSHPSPIYISLLESLRRYNIKYKLANKGQMIKLDDDVSAKILHPNNNAAYSDPNNSSIVMRLECKNISFMLTGDAEQDDEFQILREFPDVKSDVLLVGHHGSKSSTSYAWLNRVKPSIAVISAGKKYDHPSREVLDKLKAYNCKVYNTSRNGGIVISTDGLNLKVKKPKKYSIIY